MEKLQFNTILASLLKNLKKDLGALSVRQNYRGTGSCVAHRQLYVRLPGNVVTDIWLKDFVGIGGVIRMPGLDEQYRYILHGNQTPEQVYALILERMKEALKNHAAWLESKKNAIVPTDSNK